MRFQYYILALLISCIIQACSNNPGFDNAPQIDFISFSKDTLVQGSLFTDSIFLTIAFRDGDGDLGTDVTGTSQNIFIKDSRTNEIFDRFKIPSLPISGGQTGIEGEITMKIYTTCCIFPDGTPPCLAPKEFPTDELSLEIVMQDDSGKMSNTVQTTLITLLCE